MCLFTSFGSWRVKYARWRVAGQFLLFAVIGLVVSVGCSWWIAFRGDFQREIRADFRQRVVKSDTIGPEVESHLSVSLSPEVAKARPFDVLESSYRSWFIFRREYVTGELQPAPPDRWLVLRPSPGEYAKWTVVSGGFPLPAMTLEFFDESHLWVWTGSRAKGLAGGFLWEPTDLEVRRTILPLAIEPLPMAFNVCFWGGSLWLIVWGSRRLTWRYNARTGLCPSCGYDTRGLARCPECGAEMNVGSATGGAVAAGSGAGRA